MSDTDDSEVERLATAAIQTVIPVKSKHIYEAAYATFDFWLSQKKSKTITEMVMLAYFQERSTKYKPNTLWSEYSKLRTMIHLRTKVDISTFFQLTAFLKRQSKGYLPKKSKAFLRDELHRFLLEADDEKFLLLKVSSLLFRLYFLYSD